MGIVAGFLVQNTLKHLLNFGRVSPYLGYNAMKDYFPTMDIQPNPGCTNSTCCRLQGRYLKRRTRRKEEKQKAEETPAEEEGPLHEDNE